MPARTSVSPGAAYMNENLILGGRGRDIIDTVKETQSGDLTFSMLVYCVSITNEDFYTFIQFKKGQSL